jgi:YVTN family beta-propeller protein
VQTGAISGTPNAVGNFNVVVAASDGINTATQSFLWTIADPAPLQVQPPPPPAALLFGGQATYTAGVTNGENARVRWDFDDGTPVTDWSTETTVTHTFTRPGVYYVTVTATDDRGVQVSQTFVQAVHLPLTANRPTASSTIAWEPRAAGSRVWVVNQDNDTASVFNAATNAKIAEIAVGAAPRSVAVAPNGRIWVTNKQGASISSDRSDVADCRADGLAAARFAAVRHRVRSNRQRSFRRVRGQRRVTEARSGDGRHARLRQHRAECTPAVDER